MTDERSGGWGRRKFLRASTLLALATGLPLGACGTGRLASGDAPSERQRKILREVSQLTLPRTGTPGAGDVGAGDFVILALAHGLEGSRKPLAPGAAPILATHTRDDGSLDHVGWLEAELDRRTDGDWMKQGAAQRAAALSALDAEAFGEDAGDHPWRTVKGLILTGYYTSQVGGAQELRFELVPGRYDPDLPVTPATRAWSSDWTAVDFG